MRTSNLLGFAVMLTLLGVAAPWVAFFHGAAMGAEEAADMRAAFEEHYRQFKAHCDSVTYDSTISARLDSPHYEAIVALGIPALPYIIEKKRQEPDFHWISWAATQIARVVRDPEAYPWAKQERTITWWEGGQKLANEHFGWAYEQWKQAQAEGRAEDAEKFFKTMRAIGLAGLPPMMEKIAAGEVELLPIVDDLTRDTADTAGATPEEKTQACVSWWQANKSEWLIPFPDQENPTTVAAAFEEHYRQFKAHCDSVTYDSSISARLNSPHYEAIVALGIPALSHIVQKRIEDPDLHWIAWAWIAISRAIPDPNIYPWVEDRLTTWWDGGQTLANERFEWAYEQWKQAQAEGRAEDAEKFFKTMRAIGIAALPPMMEKIAAGEVELLPTVYTLTKGTADTAGATPEEKTQACVSWWQANKSEWLIPFPDQVQLAIADPTPANPGEEDAVVWLRDVCEEAGAAVYWIQEANAAIVAYESKAAWFQVGNPVAVLDGVETELPLAPSVVEGRMMVPMASLVEWLDGALRWDQQAQLVYVNPPPAAPEYED